MVIPGHLPKIVYPRNQQIEISRPDVTRPPPVLQVVASSITTNSMNTPITSSKPLPMKVTIHVSSAPSQIQTPMQMSSTQSKISATTQPMVMTAPGCRPVISTGFRFPIKYIQPKPVGIALSGISRSSHGCTLQTGPKIVAAMGNYANAANNSNKNSSIRLDQPKKIAPAPPEPLTTIVLAPHEKKEHEQSIVVDIKKEEKEDDFENVPGEYQKLFNYIEGFQPSTICQDAEILLNGEICIVNEISFFNPEGIVLVDCPVCKIAIGLVAVESHLEVEHPDEHKTVTCLSPTCTKSDKGLGLYLHVLNNHSTFPCPKCNIEIDVQSCRGHLKNGCLKDLSFLKKIPKALTSNEIEGLKSGKQSDGGSKERENKLVRNFLSKKFPEARIRCHVCLKYLKKSQYKIHLLQKHSKKDNIKARQCFLCQEKVFKLVTHLQKKHRLPMADAELAKHAFFNQSYSKASIKLNRVKETSISDN